MKGGMSARRVLPYIFDALRKPFFIFSEQPIIPSALDD